MKPLSELPRNAKLIEVLRWLGVLPAALLADFVVLRLVGAVFAAAHIISSGGVGGPLGWDGLPAPAGLEEARARAELMT